MKMVRFFKKGAHILKAAYVKKEM